uniref:Uncharacterized protein n=1 Tax=mine drainage metagenome TaxID=410659 RepID=E6QNJ8_9ZZZZ
MKSGPTAQPASANAIAMAEHESLAGSFGATINSVVPAFTA